MRKRAFSATPSSISYKSVSSPCFAQVSRHSQVSKKQSQQNQGSNSMTRPLKLEMTEIFLRPRRISQRYAQQAPICRISVRTQEAARPLLEAPADNILVTTSKFQTAPDPNTFGFTKSTPDSNVRNGGSSSRGHGGQNSGVAAF